MLHGAEYVLAPFDVDALTRAITPLTEGSGLRKGDVLLAVNGKPLEGLADFEGALRKSRRGDVLRVRVRSANSEEKDLAVSPRPFTYLGFAAGTPAYPWVILVRIAMPLLCLALGFWVAAVRVEDRSAWLLLLLMLSIANQIGDSRTLEGNQDSLQPFLTGFGQGLANVATTVLALFGIVFPERLGIDRRLPWLKWLVLAPLVVRSAMNAVTTGLLLHHLNAAAALNGSPVSRMFAAVILPMQAAALAMFFIALTYKSITAESRDARRRLLLLDAGAAAGILPLSAAFVFFAVTTGRWEGWVAVFAIALVAVFPLTMAYVIVVHRAMDVRVVIRQGLQYLLATRGIRAAQFVISAAVVIFAATVSTGSSVVGRVIPIAVGFALLAGVTSFAQRLRGWIDRRFFREAYEADVILSDLASRVRTMVETGPLLETVASRISQSLHVSRIAILLNTGGGFRPAFALGYGMLPDAVIAEHGATVKRLEKQSHALVEFDDADSWVHQADREERASLQLLGPDLLLPLSLNEKLLGLMSLGPKQSEEPFSSTDLRLLDSVAAQTGLALENGRLTDAIRSEVAAREKQKRELELAHEVQERLFPQHYPTVARLDYAGACRPALGVGGDYYDFIALPDARLGIAVGDVSGKGIPAALLMATLRAFLRAQTVQHESNLTTVMANLNNLIFESSAANRYATLFYAEFDPSSLVLTYVNAGHNPPMLFRSCEDTPVLLEAGGSVVGLMPDCSFGQGRVTLAPGDLLVAFTDGISEALNAEDEEWGEDRLIGCAAANRNLGSRSIIERIMRDADGFVAGAPQYDDMTAVILRIA